MAYTANIADFDFGEDLPVTIDTGGEFDVTFGGQLQFEFGVNLGDEIDLADRVFLVGYEDAGVPNDTSAPLLLPPR